uniref:Uncharacterized protein n=1 Tax=Glossina pallidipes TaxID=7398 RepID=A0A1B0A4P2_GLOPL
MIVTPLDLVESDELTVAPQSKPVVDYSNKAIGKLVSNPPLFANKRAQLSVQVSFVKSGRERIPIGRTAGAFTNLIAQIVRLAAIYYYVQVAVVGLSVSSGAVVE